MKLTDDPQENFLDELEALCKKYSTNGDFEWEADTDMDHIRFRYFYMDVEHKAPPGAFNKEPYDGVNYEQ
jgi:hypothetical protein